jgi:hypothetical protein
MLGPSREGFHYYCTYALILEAYTIIFSAIAETKLALFINLH